MLNRFRLKLEDGANDSDTIIPNNALKNGPDGSKTAYVCVSFSLLEPEVLEAVQKGHTGGTGQTQTRTMRRLYL